MFDSVRVLWRGARWCLSGVHRLACVYGRLPLEKRVGTFLGVLILLGLRAWAFSDAGVCAVTFQDMGLYVYAAEYRCVGGKVLAGEKNMRKDTWGVWFAGAQPMPGQATANAPTGWDGMTGTSWDTCSCGGGPCSGTCGYYVMNGLVYPASNNCSAGCSCPSLTAGDLGPDGYYTRNCQAQTCSGTCYYTESGGHWVLAAGECTNMPGCACPLDLSGPCPTTGATTSVPCGSSGGTCTSICAGNCNYIGVSNGAGGWTWALDSSTCVEGANNCTCPNQPGGACPTSYGETRSIGCGSSDGGPCVPNCSGTCTYYADNGHWVLRDSTCPQGAQNCGCPTDPGGPCPPQDATSTITTTIACGAPGGPCTHPSCWDKGGDEDGDGCCHDDDCDDNDRMKCAPSTCQRCLGACEYVWHVRPCGPGMVYRWDGEGWVWESGECGRCTFVPPVEPGDSVGQLQTVDCVPDVSDGQWAKGESTCHYALECEDENGEPVDCPDTCICGVMPRTKGTSDGQTVSVPCDQHCADGGGDDDGDGCCKAEDFDDNAPAWSCGCECTRNPLEAVASLTRRFDRLPVIRVLRHYKHAADGDGVQDLDGIIEIDLKPALGGHGRVDPTRTIRLNFNAWTITAGIRAVSLCVAVFFTCTSIISIFKV